MQINKLHTFVNELIFVKMSLMDDLGIDIRTKGMLNLTSSQKDCVV